MMPIVSRLPCVSGPEGLVPIAPPCTRRSRPAESSSARSRRTVIAETPSSATRSDTRSRPWRRRLRRICSWRSGASMASPVMWRVIVRDHTIMPCPDGTRRRSVENAGRTNTVLAKLSVVGDLLMLQLVFVVLGLGIITFFPAAFAMQRVLPDAISQDRPKLLRHYFGQFAWAMKRFWLSGFALYVGSVMLAFGISFWAFAQGPARIFALVVLIPLTGMILGLYLSGLATLPDAADDATMKTLFRSANLFLLRRPLPVAGGVVVLLTWFALASQVPTLLVVGSGLVPALTAYALSTKPREKTSDDVSI